MQTPLQIANDVVDKHLGIRPAGTPVTFALSLEQIRDMIMEGIDFDQEQRIIERYNDVQAACRIAEAVMEPMTFGADGYATGDWAYYEYIEERIIAAAGQGILTGKAVNQ